MITLSLFILSFTFIGFSWVGLSNQHKGILYNIGYGFLYGQIFLLSIVALGLHNNDLFYVIVSILLLCSLVLSYCNKLTNSKIIFRNILSTRVFVMLGITILYSIYLFCNGTLDTMNHYYFASQVKFDKVPPSNHGFPLADVKYHYGWDLLLGFYGKISGLSFDVISIIISILFIISSIIILEKVLLQFKLEKSLVNIGLFTFFLGGGYTLTVSSILGLDRSNNLSIITQIGQSSWVFGLLVFLILVDILQNFSFNKNSLLQIVIVQPILLTIGLTTASGYVLVLMTFVLLFLELFIRYKRFERLHVKLFLLTLVFLFFLIVTNNLKGFLISGHVYDNPKFIFAPIEISFNIYFKRVIAYLFVYAPLTFIICIYLVVTSLKDLKKVINISLEYKFLYSCIIGLYLFPLFIWVENSAYWDNFCKFNFFGIIASLLMFPLIINEYFILKRFSKKKILIISIFLVALISYENLYKIGLNLYDYEKKYAVQKKNIKQDLLIKEVMAHIDLEDNIYLLTDKVKSMYEVDNSTNKSNVNFYDYINKNFGQFKIIPMQTGRSVANFYDFNFFMNRELEMELWQTLNGLYSGSFTALNKIKGSFLISSKSNKPYYLNEWFRENRVELIAESNQEDWIMYFVKK